MARRLAGTLLVSSLALSQATCEELQTLIEQELESSADSPAPSAPPAAPRLDWSEGPTGEWVDPSACGTPPVPVRARAKPRRGARPKPAFEPATSVVWGGPGDEVLATGGVDDSGSAYLVGHTHSFHDDKHGNLFAVRFDGDGSLAWAREWGGPEEDRVPPPGPGAEGAEASGAGAVGGNGDVYVAGRSRSHGAGYFAAAVVAYDRQGRLRWERLWKPSWSGRRPATNAEAQAVDLCGERLLVAGTTGADAGAAAGWVFVLVLDAASGALLYARAFDPSPARADRLYAVRCAPGGAVYAAGWGGRHSTGLVLRLDGGEVDWVVSVPIGFGSAFTDLDVDAAGNAYLACRIEHRDGRLQVLALDPTGKPLWGRTANEGRRRASTAYVGLVGCSLLVGGTGAFTGYDPHGGDSVLLRFGLDGRLLAAHNHYTGKRTTDMMADRLQAAAGSGSLLWAMGTIWPTGPAEKTYAGRWYAPDPGVGELSVGDLKVEKDADCPARDFGPSTLRDAKALVPAPHEFDVTKSSFGGPARKRRGRFGRDVYLMALPAKP